MYEREDRGWFILSTVWAIILIALVIFGLVVAIHFLGKVW